MVDSIESENMSNVDLSDFNLKNMMVAAVDVEQKGTVKEAATLLNSQQYYQFG